MSDPAKMGKVQIREFLVQEGFSEEKLKSNTVEELRNILDGHLQAKTATDTVLDSLEEEGDVQQGSIETEDIPAVNQDPPNIIDPEWTQFVLGEFEHDEVDGENPRVEGLRRVAEKLIGPIIVEECELIQAPDLNNNMTACVKATFVFASIHHGREITVSALADANAENVLGNAESNFALYLTAMADTRAKGRVLRNALRLRRVIAAEEVSDGIPLMSDPKAALKNNAMQFTFAKMMCKRLGLKIEDVITDMGLSCKKTTKGDLDLSSLSDDDMMKIMKKLNDLNAERVKNDQE